MAFQSIKYTENFEISTKTLNPTRFIPNMESNKPALLRTNWLHELSCIPIHLLWDEYPSTHKSGSKPLC